MPRQTKCTHRPPSRLLGSIGTEKLNDSVVKALRLWMCSTHPYAVVQQWEHALDTLAIRA